jgi:oxygen-dependent protoporphyrinogen oxidase
LKEAEAVQVVVIGAGVAGAAAAHALRSDGVEPIVLEAAEAIGGRTRTVAHEGFAIDSGAIFVMGSYARTLAFLRESGHAAELGRWIARTAVMDESGRKREVRFDRPWTLLAMPQLSWRDRLRCGRVIATLVLRGARGPFDIDDLVALDDGVTLADWARQALGERGFEYLLRPLMDPLTGADPEVISAAFTLALMSQVTRTQLTVPVGGMGAIAAWLLDGIDVRLNTRALTLAMSSDGVRVTVDEDTIDADAAIVATDLAGTRSLLRDVADDAVHAALDQVVPIPAYHVLFGYRTDPWPGSAYDLVVRAGQGMHHDYGVLMNSRRAPGLVPPGGQSVSVYLDHAQTLGLSKEEIVARARAGIDQAFGPATPDFHRVFALDVSLIAPVPGHYTRMRSLRDGLPERIRVAGDFLTHSGIEGALLSGERAAHDLRTLQLG